jgi:RNA polymerase sigma-70 factor (ECF subfamily)
MADQLDSFYQKVLVIRCQLGDRAAFEELVAAYQMRLRGFLAKLLADRTSVDDLAQEVWMDVFRGLPRLVDSAAFAPWFYRIARNRAFRQLRRRGVKFESLGVETVTGEIDSEADFTADDAEAVHGALDQLGPEHRAVVLLRYIDDLSYEEIATAMGCHVGTVKSRLHNAKRALREILKERNYYE